MEITTDIYLGDSKEQLKLLPENSVDLGDGKIDWEKLVRFNSASKKPKNNLNSS